ncbi:glucosaminidase domain-containing protein [Neptunicella marina]|uniref:Glucosaminidase domain-containing protein n=1 Tax=Neptunicella marina TaxID=2125989 RepID=A0A8J6IWF8_9ALTE|nr:glucosaminidase domain-containing protein [Neptunicella marina]MBC3766935.1 glucosaminidase domain-containing protein [Neptunicella marina]
MNPSLKPNSMRKHAFSLVSILVVVVAAIYPFLQPAPEPKVKPSPQAQNIPDFAKFKNIKNKKKAFFNYLRPELEHQNQVIKQDREFVLTMYQKWLSETPLDDEQQSRLDEIADTYQLENSPQEASEWNILMRRVDTIPVELTLVQAANESAWGTSRFAQKGYNFFGLWCYRKGCGFVPRRRDDDAEHEVAKFRDLEHAVGAYLRNLNTYYAYTELRIIRAELRRLKQPITAEAIAQGLINYSTRREEYVDELVAMIRHNRKYMK